MKIKVRTFPNDDIDNIEAKINELLGKPESAGYSLAAVSPAPDGTNLLLIFQKP
jgi:hypothetical protein